MTSELTPISGFSGQSGQRKMIAIADEMRAMFKEKDKQAAAKTGKQWLVPVGPSKHAVIEAWQYLGQRVGLIARTADTREIRNPVTGEFEGAEVVAEVQRIDTGDIIGRAVQVCYADEVIKKKDGSIFRRWNDEEGKPNRHAIIGMAQTRAQSRALASVLRFLMEMAGIAGTPAEEMDGVTPDAKSSTKKPKEKDKPKDEADVISAPQVKRLYAISKNVGKFSNEYAKELIGRYGYESSKEIKKGAEYNDIIELIQVGEAVYLEWAKSGKAWDAYKAIVKGKKVEQGKEETNEEFDERLETARAEIVSALVA